jgi:small-conductance mechanosensitive channel
VASLPPGVILLASRLRGAFRQKREGRALTSSTWARHVPVIAAAAIVLLSILLGFLARWQFLTRLGRYAERTPWAADTAIIASMRWPLPVWCLLGGLYAAMRIVSVPPLLARSAQKTLLAALVLSVSFWAASLLGRLLELRGARVDGVRAASSTGVVRTLVKIAVLAVGTLVLLGLLGISVTPLLTTMGLGGLAVAFGLRETLANLIAGMNFTLAGNINLGDFVKLGSGEEGYVEDIQWRVTRIRTLFHTVVVIPNRQLAETIVTNYHQPSADVAIVIPVGVHAASDLEQVERVTCQVGRQIMKTIPGAVPEFEPLVRYRAFGDSTIDFDVILRLRTYPDILLVRHEFIKALVRAFAAEGIVIPFPVRALNLEQERAGAARGMLSAGAPPESSFEEH